MEDLLQVGGIANTHGIRGEVKVFPMTDDVRRFRDLDRVKLDTGKGYLDLEIENVRFFKNMVILKFKGVNNINDIEKYKGCGLWITRDQAVELEEDEYFVADLIGLRVIDEQENEIGSVKDVISTGANDVYIVDRNNRKYEDKENQNQKNQEKQENENDKADQKRKEPKTELLLPAIKDCILEINVKQGYMKVHMMEGLE